MNIHSENASVIIPVPFHDRVSEIELLSTWVLKDNCRLIGVFGIGGIGKTVTVAKLVNNISSKFDFVIWRSLRNAPPFQNLIHEINQVLSNEKKSASSDEKNLGDIPQLMNYLETSRCLIVLDEIESLMHVGARAGYFQENFEEMGRLLQIIGISHHRSCIVVIGREKPSGFDELSISSWAKFIHLAGLGTSEAESFLHSKGLTGTSEQFIELWNQYSGNPLALTIVAKSIDEWFNGDVANFLSNESAGIPSVIEFLKDQFNRLSGDEIHIICLLALHRRPLTIDNLENYLKNYAKKSELSNIIRSLQQRYIIEKTSKGYCLQPVLLEYVVDRFSDLITNIQLSPQEKEKTDASFSIQVFLSYAREDEKIVDSIYRRLSNLGFQPWMDKYDILPGERWELSIKQAIQNSHFVLICLSKNSINKRGYLQKEILDALSYSESLLSTDIFIIPVRLDDCEVPNQLKSIQWMNFSQESDWEKLVQAIQVGFQRRKNAY